LGPLSHLANERGIRNERSLQTMETNPSTANEGRYAPGRSTLLRGLSTHRCRRGLTQRQLGELAGVAHTTVQRLESLSRGAYPRTVRKLAAALGVGPADLVGSESR
jgi:DNA-binding XRE family transcriptional regulator